MMLTSTRTYDKILLNILWPVKLVFKFLNNKEFFEKKEEWFKKIKREELKNKSFYFQFWLHTGFFLCRFVNI